MRLATMIGSLGEVYFGLHLPDVRALLAQHPALVPVLRDAVPHLRSHFGPVRGVLTVVHRDGQHMLLLGVENAPKGAASAFEQAWWGERTRELPMRLEA